MAIAAVLAVGWFVAVPVGFGVYLTHLPSRKEIRDSDLGARKQAVTLTGADGLRLGGWYVPSRNRAAVIALHGTGSSRLGVERHARMLVGHGYGVLALDLRGHGESDGRSTSAPWTMDDDIADAIQWLAARRDVDPRRSPCSASRWAPRWPCVLPHAAAMCARRWPRASEATPSSFQEWWTD